MFGGHSRCALKTKRLYQPISRTRLHIEFFYSSASPGESFWVKCLTALVLVSLLTRQSMSRVLEPISLWCPLPRPASTPRPQFCPLEDLGLHSWEESLAWLHVPLPRRMPSCADVNPSGLCLQGGQACRLKSWCPPWGISRLAQPGRLVWHTRATKNVSNLSLRGCHCSCHPGEAWNM